METLQEIKKGLFDTNVRITKTSLTINPNTNFEEWTHIGEILQNIEGAIHFWVGDWISFGEHKWGEKYAQAIEETRYKIQTLKNDVWVSSNVDSSRRRDNLSFGHHAEVAKLEPKEQTEWLNRAIEEKLTTRELRAKIRAATRTNQPLPLLPEGKFNIIYADPPWQYEHPISDSRRIEEHYPTLDLKHIKDIEVPSADNAVLYLWITSPLIKQGLEVMEAWGFTFRTTAVWDKRIIGPGYWFRQQHEILLVGVRGEFSPPEPCERVSSVYGEKRTKHSKKPMYYYELIETMYPEGKYLELFSRNKRPKWTGWGLDHGKVQR